MKEYSESAEGTVGTSVQAFYNRTPFPDFDLDRFNRRDDLRDLAWPMARLLDFIIPVGASVVDVGCGTGQLAALLSLRRTRVLGIDFSDSSLSKAAALKEKLGLPTVTFKKFDIMDELQLHDIIKPFDYLLCLGVLHHTADPCRSFRHILPLLKPGGFLAVGLYNRYGRFPLRVRQAIVRTFPWCNDFWRKKFIRMQIGDVEDKERARGWWNDQYGHPHESLHTIGEVLQWFDQNGIQYMHSAPPVRWGGLSEPLDFWSRTCRKPSSILRGWAQAKWLFSTHVDGGYWLTLGKKG